MRRFMKRRPRHSDHFGVFVANEKKEPVSVTSSFFMPRTGIEPARITPHAPQTCASTNSATWAYKEFKDYLFVGALAFALALTVFAGLEFAVFTAGPGSMVAVFAALPEFAFVLASAAAAGLLSVDSDVVCKTETLPLIAGSESSRAESIKIAATVMVSFESTDCVPRGPNAVLEILLVNNAPASVLPGCRSTATIRIKHEIKNKP
jgi:hypothetical protein